MKHKLDKRFWEILRLETFCVCFFNYKMQKKLNVKNHLFLFLTWGMENLLFWAVQWRGCELVPPSWSGRSGEPVGVGSWV